MGHALSALVRFLGRTVLLLAAIVLLLAAAQWLRGEWPHLRRIANELPLLEQKQAELSRRQQAMARRLTLELGRLGGAGLAQIDARLRGVERDIARLEREDAAARARVSLLSAALEGGRALPEQLFQAALRGVELELRRQEAAHLRGLRARAEVLLNRQAALARLERLRRAHAAAYGAWQDGVRRRAALEADAGLWGKLAFTPSYRQLRVLDARVAGLRAASERAHQDYLAQRTLIRQLPSAPDPSAFRVDEARLAAAGAPLREALEQVRGMAAASQAWKAWRVVGPLLPTAVLILSGCWLSLAAMRALFYFVLAPLAARRPPAVIAAGGPGAGIAMRRSAVAQTLRLAPGDELLVRPDYCQSQPAAAQVATRLLLDWRRPLTSLAARLWMLKRLRGAEELSIVLSPTADALDEIALLEIPAGQALVLQPRALAGMILPAGRPPAIRSHWRIKTLHAWLTLQLRYLAFEGPATLVLKGCRGVRIESAAAGRMLSQDASLGFSAHARYATVRAEPFLPYLLGRQPLLLDRFAGAQACFVYEEVPRSAQPGRWRNNPLGVLFDAGLKAFGI